MKTQINEPQPKITNNDAICVAFTYHFANLSVEKRKAEEILGDNFNSPDWVDKAYTELVDNLASELLPSAYQVTFTYSGGKCFSRPNRQEIMAGESRKYMSCLSEMEIKEELQRAFLNDK